MMKSKSVVGFVALGILAAAALTARAEGDQAMLAKAVSEAGVSLEQGLKASEQEGKPISGKFEIDDNALQLSVYTAKGGQFAEVIVDPKSGAIRKAETITDTDDLKDAKAQEEVMANAKVSLDAAVAYAVRANGGYLAVSVIPMLIGGHPVASINLMGPGNTKEVTQKLD